MKTRNWYQQKIASFVHLYKKKKSMKKRIHQNKQLSVSDLIIIQNIN